MPTYRDPSHRASSGISKARARVERLTDERLEDLLAAIDDGRKGEWTPGKRNAMRRAITEELRLRGVSRDAGRRRRRKQRKGQVPRVTFARSHRGEWQALIDFRGTTIKPGFRVSEMFYLKGYKTRDQAVSAVKKNLRQFTGRSTFTFETAGKKRVRKRPRAARNPWHAFLRKHAGKGYSRKTLSRMYRKARR